MTVKFRLHYGVIILGLGFKNQLINREWKRMEIMEWNEWSGTNGVERMASGNEWKRASARLFIRLK